MTNEEIWNIGLEERTDKLSKLQSEYDRLDVECRKAEFEMDMYARLRDCLLYTSPSPRDA